MRAWFVAKWTRIETLRAVRELAAFPDRQLHGLLPYMDEVRLPAGTVIAREGESCTEFVVVLGGRLRATTSSPGARTLIAGDTVGWDAMWDRKTNSATVVVEAEARLLVMSRSQFRAIRAVADIPA